MPDNIIYDFSSNGSPRGQLAGGRRWGILGAIVLVVILVGLGLALVLRPSPKSATNQNTNTAASFSADGTESAPRTFVPTPAAPTTNDTPAVPSASELRQQLPAAIQQLKQ